MRPPDCGQPFYGHIGPWVTRSKAAEGDDLPAAGTAQAWAACRLVIEATVNL